MNENIHIAAQHPQAVHDPLCPIREVFLELLSCCAPHMNRLFLGVKVYWVMEAFIT